MLLSGVTIWKACHEGMMDHVKFMLDRDPSLVNKGNHHGMTPLHFAVYQREADMVRLFIMAGADPNKKTHAALNSRTPSELAADLCMESSALDEALEARRVFRETLLLLMMARRRPPPCPVRNLSRHVIVGSLSDFLAPAGFPLPSRRTHGSNRQAAMADFVRIMRLS